MSEGNPDQEIPFDIAIKEFIEDSKKEIRSNYLKGQNSAGAWFRGQDDKKPFELQIQLITKDLFTHYGKNIDWIQKWVSSMEVAAAFANKTGRVDDVTFIVDDWETYYKNSN
ncbi:MAG: hypothetical protein V7L02_03090 [Nostoc sp.]|uniref:hypothetical protein n=1 Tax=unclassified Nostoc TaxID=2593658 RepID=UPI001DB3741C|nr:hypothetical protein [Nostoc sp. JL34]MBN3882562.1 hypothetical protein [Nostoc sp. JL34]